MASAIGNLIVRFNADTRGLTGGATRAVAAMRQVESSASRMTSALSAVGVGRFLGFAGMIAGAQQAIAASEEARIAEAKLSAVLQSTGGAAGFTTQQLTEYAANLQQVTNFEDDATVGAMAMLASFTNVRGDVFKSAVVAAMDMSTIMGQDLPSAIKLIGRALNDPLQGMTRLARAGVSFTAEQEKQIRGFMAQGDLLRAQEAILDALKIKFGGAAEAALSPFMKLLHTLGDIMENIGGLIALIIGPLATALEYITRPLGKIKEIAESIKNLIGAILTGNPWYGMEVNKVVPPPSVSHSTEIAETMAAIRRDVVAAASGSDTFASNMAKLAGYGREAAGAIEQMRAAIERVKWDKQQAAADKTLANLRDQYNLTEREQKVKEFVGQMPGMGFATDAHIRGWVANSTTIRGGTPQMDALREYIDLLDLLEVKERVAANVKNRWAATDQLDQMQSQLNGLIMGWDDARMAAVKFGQTPGITQQQISDYQRLYRRIEQEQTGKHMAEQFATPLEKYQKQMDDIKRLEGVGALSGEVAQRARLSAQSEFLRSQIEIAERQAKLANANAPSQRYAGAALAGSREAYSAILADRAQRLQGARGKPEEETAKNTDAMRKKLDKINANLDKLNAQNAQVEALGIPA